MTHRPSQLPSYRVRRSSRARRARVTISEAGEAVVVLPTRAPERAAAEIVAQYARWIERHVERIGDRNRALAARPSLDDGRELMLGGVAHALVVEAAVAGRRRSTVTQSNDAGPRITVSIAASDGRTPGAILESWLRGIARERITARVAARANEMGIAPMAIAIRDQRSRWGSASGGGALSFSWRLVLCPVHVLDYVVVHELAHLRVRGHSARFWALVGRHVAEPERARRWLRENHAQVRHALD